MELSDDIGVLKNLVVSLLSKVEELQVENAQLQARVRDLEVQNADLSQRINTNSRNSNQPPSKDLYKIKPALPKFSKGKQGGQIGHKGRTLAQSSSPDEVIELATPMICSCGLDVNDVPLKLQQKRQLFDLPKVKLYVKEYRQYSRVCPSCKNRLLCDFPVEVSQPVQYGRGVMALCNLLSSSFHLSCQQIGQLFSDLYEQPLNVATVIAANERAYRALELTEHIIKEQVLASDTAHFDETGLACEGKTHWLHTACTAVWTYLFVHTKRGKKALESPKSLIKDFTKVAVHDCWASYFGFKNASHALCNAHLLRELQALIENNSQWAIKMHALLMKLYQLTDKGKTHLDNLTPYIQEYQIICQEANVEEDQPIKKPRGKPKSSKGRNLLNRLIEHQNSVLAFAKYDTIPFTNNQAERDIRPVKGKIKNAGCFRSTDGADHFARIQSFVSSARKQSQSVFKELIDTHQGYNFITTAYASK
jgi:transposase